MLGGWPPAAALAIIKRSDDMRGFVVLPKQWIVEQFFAHLMRTHRLVRDFERTTTSAEAMAYRSMTLLTTTHATEQPTRLHLPSATTPAVSAVWFA